MNEETLFAEAIAIESPEKRKQFLDQACGENLKLRKSVEELLHLADNAGSFLKHPPVEAAADALKAIGPTLDCSDGSTYDDEVEADFSGQFEMRQHPQNPDDEISLDFLEPATREDSLGRLGHYEVLEVIGRGAFGIALRAFDEKLQRVVAVKVLSPEMAAASPARKRFLREARTSAQIRHENVVSIYAVEDDPIPYLVMEYIPGKTLQKRLDEQGPLDLPEALRLGKQIADGLAAAHAEGLIHRDIKPANILLEGGMGERVKITDFGLARTTDDASMTQSGVIAGTPMYMAPEQAQGIKLDQRADLFSYGSVLYHMLSGRPPFRAPTTMAVLKRVTEDTPRPIPEIIPEVPAWICELIGHLHAKDPEKRYGTAREVSELLAKCARELEAGRVPQIPDPSKSADKSPDDLSENNSRRRKPFLQSPLITLAAALVIMLGVLCITEATGVTGLASTVVRLTTGSGTLVIETDDPGVKIAIDGEEVTITGGGVEELTLRPGEYQIAALKDGKPVKQELVSITRNGRTVVRMSLERSHPEAPVPSTADDPTVPDVRMLEGHSSKVIAVAFSPDGRYLASGGVGTVRVWDARKGQLIHDLKVIENADYMAVTFSPDSRYLLTAPETQNSKSPISIWDAETGQLADRLEEHPGGLFQISFASDGKTLLACGYFEFVRVWDFPSRRKVRDIPYVHRWIRSVVAGTEGRIAFGSNKVTLAESDGTVINTGRNAGPYAFSRDGKRLAGTTWQEGRVTVWDGETLDEIASWIGHTGTANGVDFSPDGHTLATAGGDGKVRLWNVETQQPLIELSHDAEAYVVSFSPDGKTLATGGFDKLVKLWNLPAILAQQKNKPADSKPLKWPAVVPPPAIAPFDAKQAKAHQEAWAKYLGVPVEKDVVVGQDKDDQDIALFTVLIPPGRFLMRPGYDVTITRPFRIGMCEVTIAQFRAFVDETGYKTSAEVLGNGRRISQVVSRLTPDTPQHADFTWRHEDVNRGDHYPVAQLSWNDAVKFCEWLSEKEGKRYRLPTEAEWEWAARGGSLDNYFFGNDPGKLDEYAWYEENSEGHAHPVGLKLANPWGLFDVHGNVCEHCLDWKTLEYPNAQVSDPVGPSTGQARRTCGGGYIGTPQSITFGYRGGFAPSGSLNHFGFRIVCELDVPEAKTEGAFHWPRLQQSDEKPR